MMEYQLVQYDAAAGFIVTKGAIENIYAAFEVRGFLPTGKLSGPPLRPEIQGQPKFFGLNGPMYGGPGVVRYESVEAYAVLSA